MADGLHIPSSGIDAGDHPPITPMAFANQSQLGGDDWRLYHYIVCHFLASISPDCAVVKTKAAFSVSGEEFRASGLVVKSPGFTAIMPWLSFKGEPMPDLTGVRSVGVENVSLDEGRTSAPDYLTEAELIGLMEKNGIGTDASIPVHINNICERNYAHVQSANRTISPSKLGVALVHGYHTIDSELVLPTVRANIEENISLIAKGNADYGMVVKHALDQFLAKFRYFTAKIGLMDQLFEASFSQLAQTQSKFLTKCGKCNRFMKYMPLKPPRLYCMNCEETYSLPQNGAIKVRVAPSFRVL
eukprot:TRINITY_DN5381_c0_g1_i1.p1 TRINITY_DN5381_c0_g1~~TRINITY_DN5381_c0_g1_i1.p1  ORF type:complete len:301 (+),score=77.00 TRINITY_DN5381_c0_g1_i1:230-1132(+)